MKRVEDLQVNKADDIILIGDDFIIEPITSRSSFKNGMRRLSARGDDSIFSPEICAGIETLLQSYISDITLSELEQNIRLSLTKYNLFKNEEILVYFDQTQGSQLGVIVSFKVPGIEYNPQDEDLTFSVFIDVQNQRSYS